MSAPAIHNAWLKALSSITTASFPDEVPSDRGYILPDPNSFIDPSTKTIRTSQLHRYLHLRPTLIQRLGVTSSIVPIAIPLPGRIWRQVLSFDQGTLTTVLNPGSNAKRTKTSEDRYRAAVFLSASVDATKATSSTTLTTILSAPPVFRGEEISLEALSDSDLAKQILWELAELNFRIELGSLDQRLHRDLSPGESRPDLLDCVCSVTAPRALLVVDLQQASQGLASTDIRQRFPQLKKLRELFRSWKVSTPKLSSSNISSTSSDAISSLELALYDFYVMTFFKHFGRYPIVPRSLG
jgi:hypothetical protein